MWTEEAFIEALREWSEARKLGDRATAKRCRKEMRQMSFWIDVLELIGENSDDD